MPKKQPETFGDGFRHCLISSIAGYELETGGLISIVLKSGQAMHLDFNVVYLAKIAKEKLGSYFTLDNPESDPCTVCCRKDVMMPEEDYAHCEDCHDFSEFKAPAEKIG